MSRRFRMAYLSHSLRSDWNNGNAHFLRGLLNELGALGHEVLAFEPEQEWSLENLRAEERGDASLHRFAEVYPELKVQLYPAARVADAAMWREALRGVEVVVLHEWNPASLSHVLLELRDEMGFKLLFHDTHHRASSSPEAIAQFGTDRFDGVLAFGEALRRIYRERFGMERVWTLHEAADVRVFRPLRDGAGARTLAPLASDNQGEQDQTRIPFGNDNQEKQGQQRTQEQTRTPFGNDNQGRQAQRGRKQDVVWVGNWGDDERSAEIREFLLEPAAALRQYRFTIFGVRYPEDGLRSLADAGVRYGGYLPNLQAVEEYAASRLTVHVPRQQYSGAMTGIPTIRVFEALACGIPLLSAPWRDTEGLFREGDFRFVSSGAEMRDAMRELLENPRLAEEQAARGLETVLARHTCRHRAEEVSSILEEMVG